MKWKGKLIEYIINELKDDAKWKNTVDKLMIDSSVGIHLAVFNEPFLTLLLNGEKKFESRFSINKISPFEKVKRGDVIILKESGGPVTGAFVAGKVKYIPNINKRILDEIKDNYGTLICSDCDKNFWKNRTHVKYASLIEVKKVKRLRSFKSDKNDRTGWSVLRVGVSGDLFNEIA